MSIDPELWAVGCRFAATIFCMGFGFTVAACAFVTIIDYINRADYRDWWNEEGEL